MSSLESAVGLLDMSITAAKHVLQDNPEPLQRRLAWLGVELERLASEAYRLADEAGDDAGNNPALDASEHPVWPANSAIEPHSPNLPQIRRRR
jgi:hypothetical protein